MPTSHDRAISSDADFGSKAADVNSPLTDEMIRIRMSSKAKIGIIRLGRFSGEAVHRILAAITARAPAARFAQTMAIHLAFSELLPIISSE